MQEALWAERVFFGRRWMAPKSRLVYSRLKWRPSAVRMYTTVLFSTDQRLRWQHGAWCLSACQWGVASSSWCYARVSCIYMRWLQTWRNELWIFLVQQREVWRVRCAWCFYCFISTIDEKNTTATNLVNFGLVIHEILWCICMGGEFT